MRSPLATARQAKPNAMGRSQTPQSIDHMPKPDQMKLFHSMPKPVTLLSIGVKSAAAPASHRSSPSRRAPMYTETGNVQSSP